MAHPPFIPENGTDRRREGAERTWGEVEGARGSAADPVEHNGLAFTMNIATGPPTTYCRLDERTERRTGRAATGLRSGGRRAHVPAGRLRRVWWQ